MGRSLWTAWGENDGANLALVACLLCAVDFIASASAIVAVFSAILGALKKALIRSFLTSGVAAWCTGKEIDCKTSKHVEGRGHERAGSRARRQ